MEMWMRDPFKRAQSINLNEETPLKAALRALLTKIGMLDRNPLLATPGNRITHVIDARKEGVCKACGNEVWLSPSSKVRLQEEDGDKLVVICLQCLEDTHEKLSEEAGKPQ